MRRLWKFTVGVISAGILCLLFMVLYMQQVLPDAYSIVEGEQLFFHYPVTLVQATPENQSDPSDTGESYKANLKFLNALQIKKVEVNIVDRKRVIVLGQPFGIKMFVKGLLIVGTSDIISNGNRCNPAKEAGLKVGDSLLSFNDVPLTSNEQLGELMAKNGTNPIQMQIMRDGNQRAVIVQPQRSDADQQPRIGIWLRDSSAGIGTLTFYDQNHGILSGLGHAVCDVDTGEIMPLARGEMISAEITGFKKASDGSPGELKGQFVSGGFTAEMVDNTTAGVFGRIYDPGNLNGTEMEVAMAHEVKVGAASILTTISGSTPKQYDIVIEKVLSGSNADGQNIIIRIIDEELLKKTGGIVQGMSGSPIIQDGKLVGAVTHVFVNDPSKGYGVFVENILSKETLSDAAA